MSNDVERRVFEHKCKVVEGFTKQYGLDKLVYFESYQYVNEAILREKDLKSGKDNGKLILLKAQILIGMIWRMIGILSGYRIKCRVTKKALSLPRGWEAKPVSH